MARKHPSSEQIQSMLREGHFGQSRELPDADPINITQMRLEIDRIELYDRNPRRERNPLHDEIKESIRAQGGLNNPLTVTRRPGETRYMVESGGNTRLQALKELWTETGDERFYRIHCLFRPWVSESHVLTAHLIENDKRGALAFIDKALGVRALRQVLESEQQASLSQRQLSEALRARGYGLDQSMISRMDYAVDVLLPLIPEALRAGMGAPQVRRIRRIETACRRLWNDQQQPTEQFDVLFSDVLGAHDGPHCDQEALQRALEVRIAEVTSLPLKQIRLEIDARLAGDDEIPVLPNPSIRTQRLDPVAPDKESLSSAAAPERKISRPADPQPSPADNAAGLIDVVTPPVYDGPADRKSLRSQCYVLALKIAKRHNLEDCVMPAGKLGLGFLVDVPREPIIPVVDQDNALNQGHRQWIWWLLLSLSEEAVHPERMEQAPEDLLLRNLVLEGNEDRALALVGEPDWKALGYTLLSDPALPQSTIDNLWALAQACRLLRIRANDDGSLSLWRSGE